jgi:uncharacterized protein
MDGSYTLAGFVVGAIVGLTGVGGGALMTPLLVLLFGINPTTAVGTDLLYAALTKSVGVGVHQRNRTVDWRITGRLAAGSLPAAAVALYFLSQYDVKSSSVGQMLTAILGVALVLTAGALLARRPLQRWASRPGVTAWRERHITAATIAAGAALGALVTLSSVGAGALGVTAIALLYPQLQTVRIVGTDISHAVPLTLIAGLGHWWLGNVDWLLLGSLLLGSIPGIALGSHFAVRVPERVLRPILATLLVAIGGKLSLPLLA